MSMGIGLCPVITLALVILAIVLLLRHHHTARVLGWVLLGILGVGFLMTLMSVSIPAYRRHAELRQRARAAVEVRPGQSSGTAANIDWPAEAGEEFEPDVHPSLAAAARGGAVRLVESLDQVMLPEEMRSALIVTGDIDRETLGRVAQAIGRKMPSPAPVVREGSTTTTQPGDNQVVLEIRKLPLPAEEPQTYHGVEETPWYVQERQPIEPYSPSEHRWQIDRHKARIEAYKRDVERQKAAYKKEMEIYKARVKANPGAAIPVPQFRLPSPPVFGEVQGVARTLELVLRGPKGSVNQQVRFVDKPWAENFGEFVARAANKHWLIGRSPRPCASESEAHDQALANAAGQLYPMLRDQLQKSAFRLPIKTFNETYEVATLIPFLRSRLERDGVIRDRFIQHFQRPYGNVVREALLVDASPASIRTLANRYRDGLTGARMGLRGTLLSLAGMVVLICGVYAFLNAATQGYYTWSLRLAAVVIGIVVVGLILFMHDAAP